MTHDPTWRTADELVAGIASIEASPRDVGSLDLIVRRPAEGEREVLEIGELDRSEGLSGDTWNQRFSKRTDDGTPHPDMQLNIMGSRSAALVAGDRDRWSLAGDQLFVDLDVSVDNLPTGTRLEIGDAVVEVTDQPHTGCAKFSSRFGLDALRFVNSEAGSRLRVRGINARVVQPGTIRRGDIVRVVRVGAMLEA